MRQNMWDRENIWITVIYRENWGKSWWLMLLEDYTPTKWEARNKEAKIEMGSSEQPGDPEM